MNEVINYVESLNNKTAVKGNKESRMIEAIENNYDISFEQLAPLRWNIENIAQHSYDFIKSLPDKITIKHDDIDIYAAHSPSQHFGGTLIDNIDGRSFAEQFGKDYSNHNDYLHFITESIASDKLTCKVLNAMPDGIYLFGHYHTQWNVYSNGKYLVNPGACGLPLDFDCSAPYTILDIDNGVQIIERRVSYDVETAANSLICSGLLQASPFWYELAVSEFLNAKAAVVPFLEFAERLAAEKNDYERPFSNKLWHEAIRLYTND